jgi:hypothetical protein
MDLTGQKILGVVLHALAAINESKPTDEQFQAEPATPLIGRASVLTSLELVAFILELETRLYEDFGLQITLADDRAFSQSRSPFRTPSSLAEYILAGVVAKTT